MSGVTKSPMPNIATSRDKQFARVPVDPAQTSFFEGREFRIVRKISTPIVYRFTCEVDFILSYQAFSVASGEYEFRAWRDDNVNESGTWSTSIPVLMKNISSEQLDPVYSTQTTINSGGTITVIDSDMYADFAWLKTAGGTGQQISVSAQSIQGRYLAAGSYYLEFTGTGQGAYYLEWEERP